MGSEGVLMDSLEILMDYGEVWLIKRALFVLIVELERVNRGV